VKAPDMAGQLKGGKLWHLVFQAYWSGWPQRFRAYVFCGKPGRRLEIARLRAPGEDLPRGAKVCPRCLRQWRYEEGEGE